LRAGITHLQHTLHQLYHTFDLAAHLVPDGVGSWDLVDDQDAGSERRAVFLVYVAAHGHVGLDGVVSEDPTPPGFERRAVERHPLAHDRHQAAAVGQLQQCLVDVVGGDHDVPLVTHPAGRL